MRRTTATVVLATLIGSSVTLFALPAAASPDVSAEATSHSWVNERRSSQGLRSLALDSRLVEAARRHAQRMADRGEVYHNSNLGNEVNGFRSLGENVGAGFSIEAINDAFWGSPGHRANIVASAFTHVGFGVVTREGEVYAVQVFGDEDAPETSSKPAEKRKPRAKPSPRASSPEPKPSASSSKSRPSSSQAPRPSSAPETPAPATGDPAPEPTPSGPAPQPTPSGPAPAPTPSGLAPTPSGAAPGIDAADPVQGLDVSTAGVARSQTRLWLA